MAIFKKKKSAQDPQIRDTPTTYFHQSPPEVSLNNHQTTKMNNALRYKNPSRNPYAKRATGAMRKGREAEFIDPNTDGRRLKLEEWEIEGPGGLLRLWESDENGNWKRHPELFRGMWRNTTRKELRKLLCTASHDKYKVATLLKRMRSTGEIDVWYSIATLPDGRIITDMWIKFNIERYLELAQQGYDLAAKHPKYKRMINGQKTYWARKEAADKQATEEAGKMEENTAVSGAADTGAVIKETPSETGDKVVASVSDFIITLVPKEEINNASGGSVEIFHTQKHPIPEDYGLYEFSEVTVSVLLALQASGIFPHNSFTFPVLRKVEYWTTMAAPGHRMTLENIKEWLNARQCWTESGAWQFEVNDVSFLVSRWIPILRKMRTTACAERADSGAECAAKFNKASIMQNLQDEMEHVKLVVAANPNVLDKCYGGDIVKYLTSPTTLVNAFPNSPANLLSNLLVLYEFGVDLKQALSENWQRLRDDLIAMPEWFYFLESVLPLQAWSRMTEDMCGLLRKRAKAIYEDAQHAMASAMLAAM